MKTRIISVIVCLCILIGIAAGCETKEKAALFPTEEIISETENDSEGENGSPDFTGGQRFRNGRSRFCIGEIA